MDRLQYHILLEEAGIYTKKKITPEEAETMDGDFVYKDERDKKIYEIIPNELSVEEVKVALLAKQLNKLNYIYNLLSIIVILILITFILSLFF